jgi:hypothetical protein
MPSCGVLIRLNASTAMSQFRSTPLRKNLRPSAKSADESSLRLVACQARLSRRSLGEGGSIDPRNQLFGPAHVLPIPLAQRAAQRLLLYMIARLPLLTGYLRRLDRLSARLPAARIHRTCGLVNARHESFRSSDVLAILVT